MLYLGYPFTCCFLSLHSFLECCIRIPISDQSSVLNIINLGIVFVCSFFEDTFLFRDNGEINSVATFGRDNSTVKLVESGCWVLC